MSCDRCTDIHTAQKEGKCQKSCECNCHDKSNDSVLRFDGGGWCTSTCCNSSGTTFTGFDFE